MNHRKAQFVISLFGREGARIFYGVVGLIVVVLGVFITMGFIKNAT